MLAKDRVRRLYCLSCGDAAYTPLPCENFVKTHVERHNVEVEEANFLVVERPVNEPSIKLDDNLSTMFQKEFLEWGGAVEKASKYEERAKKSKIGTQVEARL